jgi:hypothetical protein
MSRVSRALGVPAIVAALLSAGCGGGSSSSESSSSSSSIKGHLLPASVTPQFRVQRTLNWSDAVDVVGEGLALPEAVHPSSVVNWLKDNGYVGGRGEVLVKGAPPNETEIRTGFIKFGSPDQARKAQTYLNKLALQQPCFTACVFSPRQVKLAGLSNVTMVEQLDRSKPPPGARKLPPGGASRLPPGAVVGPPANFAFEFTSGPYVYFANLAASAGFLHQIEAGARAYYAQVKAQK